MNAQDLLVTVAGDSLNVRMHDGNGDYVRFDYTDYLRTTVRQLPKNRVRTIVPNYFAYLKMAAQTKVPGSADTLVHTPEIGLALPIENAFLDTVQVRIAYQPTWNMGVYTGLSKRLYGTKIGLNQMDLDYDKKVKSGFTIGAKADYFFKKKWGLGIRYDIFLSNARKDASNRSQVGIQFLGISALHRKALSTTGQYIQSSFELGYQPFSNRLSIDDSLKKLRAKSLGWGLSVAFIQPIHQRLSLSLTGSCFLGTSYKMVSKADGKSQTIHLNRNNFNDLSRAALTLGIHFSGNTGSK
ncbi:hypothetical protein CLV98_10852 [Dyadobacter jejuensis]|uniref:Outer membrane protein with beta-barrel domain n=1 Tax=Dyadobacter jejuensis TaxID=1082580 RepID=A0A316AHI5_9BACT|nr:hypothetical protein CLV98_10852 [Dyadobacter jejuensis]